jgi:putative ABC transport system permease protein
MVAAIAFGAAAVTFAVGLASSLQQIQATDNAGDVIVHPGRPATGPPPGQGPGPAAGPAPDPGPAVKLDAAAVGKVIAAQAGTGSYFGTASTEVTVAGLTKSVEARTFTGDTSGAGYQMVSGSWFAGPGEIVVATPFLTATHTEVSDTVLLTAGGKQVSARIVGEAFNTEDDGMEILTAAATLAGAEADPRSMEYTITLTAGTDPQAYAEKLDSALKPLDASAAPVNKETDEMLILLNSLTTLLTVLLIVVAALGVLNTLVLETRERVHDLGVHKALGMAPRQTVAMVIASIVVTGLAGGAVGAAVGVVLQRAVVTDMAGTAGFRLPASMIEVYAPAELVVFGLGGLAIAVLGALLPAGWAARTRTATALRTE